MEKEAKEGGKRKATVFVFVSETAENEGTLAREFISPAKMAGSWLLANPL